MIKAKTMTSLSVKRVTQVGFTLLEMILVLFLVSLMASTTLLLTEGVEEQSKYDETKRRMDVMRKAIVGDATRTVNGGPEISGFVVDMGRLPLCIAELLQQRNCADDDDLVPWAMDASTSIGSGWRGPYIQVLSEQDGSLHFRDGYGNSASSIVTDAQNSGWKMFDVSGAEISLGSDGFDMSSIADDIEATPLVSANDWQANRVYINFINQNISDALPTDVAGAELNLRVYLKDETTFSTGDDNLTTTLSIASGAIPANNNQSHLFYFDASNAIPIGIHSYVVLCSDGTLFKGNCSDNITLSLPESIRLFTAVPQQNITLDWIIQ